MLEAIGGATSAANDIFGDIGSGIGSAVHSVSGSFEFPSVQEIDAVLAKWREVQDHITKQGDKLQNLVGGLQNPPAGDDATAGYMSTWADSLRSLQEQQQSMVDYCANYIEKLEAAKKAKQTGEHETTDALRKAAGGIA